VRLKQMNKKPNGDQVGSKKIPIAINEDVEYSAELADSEDMEAARRSDEADKRQE
jgi:hypothetical protein